MVLRRRVAAPVVALIPALVLASCSGDAVGDAEHFCGEVKANTEAIVNPTLERLEDVDAMLALYREVAAVAPLDIEPQWDALVVNLETASTVDPADPDSLQRVYARAYATEREAKAVRDWLIDHCGVDIGPVATIVPRAPRKAPPTTIAG